MNHRQLRDRGSAKQDELFDRIKTMVDEEHQDIGVTAGGTTYNSIRAARVWQLEHAPNSKMKFTTMGGVGEDGYADTLVELDDKLGITSNQERFGDKSTGSCLAVVVEGQRTMITDLESAQLLKVNREKIMKALEEGGNGQLDLVFSGAYFANSNGFDDVLTCSAESPLPFLLVFSLSEAFCCSDKRTHDAVSASGIIFGRVEEGQALLDSQGKEEKSLTPEEVALKVAAWPMSPGGPSQRWAVLTQGSDPVIVAVHYFDGSKEPHVSSFEVPPIDQSTIIDDCGAGDCFAGGFLGGMIAEHEAANGAKGFPDAKLIPKAVDAGLEMARRNLASVGCMCLHPAHVSHVDWVEGKKPDSCCSIV